MGLRCGIVGVAACGKTTLFNCMSGQKAQTSVSSFGKGGANVGMVQVPDERLDMLAKFYTPQKIVHTAVDIVDIPGITKGSADGNRFLADVRNTDALIHVLRCFEDPSVPHADGSVDPMRDMDTVELEMKVKDLELVEKKIEKLEKVAKSGDKNAIKGIEVLEKLKRHFEDFLPARNIEIRDTDKRFLEDMDFLSAKPVIYVCNVDESSVTGENTHVRKVRERFKEEENQILVIAAKTEAEIAKVNSLEERREFLEMMGLSEPGVNKMIRAAYNLLKLQTFFTVANKEVRAWTIREGMTAREAAGIIHSDMERGFIRTEVIRYEDLVTLGSEAECRKKGKVSVEGKNYVVEDGDILYIRFNV